MRQELRKNRFGFPALAALALAACVTVNVYFPESAIQDLSEQIEDEVQKRAAEIEEGEGDTPAEPEGSAPPGAAGTTNLLELILGVSPAYAQDVPDPGVTNPAIRAIVDSRAQRVGAINKYKSMGVIGEGKNALLVTRDLDSIADLKQRAEVQKLVKAENGDRERMFKEMAAAENVDDSQLSRIRDTYAATLRDRARPGDWIQLAGGDWKQK